MPATLTSTELLLFPALGAVGAIFLLVDLFAGGRPRFSPLALTTFMIVVVGNFEQGVIQMGGGQEVATQNAGGVTTTQVVASGMLKTIAKDSWLLVAFGCVTMAIAALWRYRQVNIAALCILMAAVSANVSAIASDSFKYSNRWLFMVVIFGSLVVMKPGFAALRGAALGLAVLIEENLFMPLLNPGSAAHACGQSKCGIFHDLYIGATFDENALGLTCALGLPALWCGLGRRARWIFVGLDIFIILASGSRTSMLTMGTGFLYIIISSIWRQRWRFSIAHLSACLLLLLGGTALVLPYLGLPDAKFTGRARLWRIALSHMGSDPGRWLFGGGPESWSHLYDLGMIDTASSYSAHNEFMTVVFVAGIAGLLLLLLGLGIGFARNAADIQPYAALLAPALVACFTERPWSIERPDWMLWGLCTIVSMKYHPREPPLSTNATTWSSPQILQGRHAPAH